MYNIWRLLMWKHSGGNNRLCDLPRGQLLTQIPESNVYRNRIVNLYEVVKYDRSRHTMMNKSNTSNWCNDGGYLFRIANHGNKYYEDPSIGYIPPTFFMGTRCKHCPYADKVRLRACGNI